MFKWITKKDLTYWLIFVLMIYLLSSDVGQAERIVLDNWSFASVVVSIILAFLAIIYTFDQSSTTLFSTRKLEESAEKIENVSSQLEKISVNNLFANLENQINNLNHIVESTIENKMNNHYEDIRNLMEQNSDKSPFIDDRLLTQEQWKQYFERYMNGKINFVAAVLLHIYHQNKYSLVYDSDEIVEWINTFKEEEKKLDVPFGKGVVYGVILMCKSLGLLEYQTSDNGLKFTNLAEPLKIEMEAAIKVNEETKFMKKMNLFVEAKRNESK